MGWKAGSSLSLSLSALPSEVRTAVSACSVRPGYGFSRSSESPTASELAVVVPVTPVAAVRS